MGNRTRDKQVKFWVTDKELTQIKKNVKKSKLTQSEYLIRSALNKNILVIEGLNEILIELSREGNNLTQIIKNMNGNDEFDTNDIIEAKDKLMNLWKLIEETLREGNE